MNGERSLFCAALELTSPTARAAFLDEACADTPDSRARLESLLRAAAAAGDFLNAAEPHAELPGTRIDRYILREPIGEGGFGVVYRAEQEQPVRRNVALKIIKLGMDTRAVVARFEAERQALALMEHPNIARVFDGGATAGGRPYFVMELVSGVPITRFCDERKLPLAERLELFLQTCRAVHHAHQKGVIHRDLKPSNVLVAFADGRPVVKVIDFGIAKATHEPLTSAPALTRQEAIIGTPAYMSPEQIGLGHAHVDTRSDIYSLGAVLHELLSGTPLLDLAALASASHPDVQRAICDSEPAPPSRRVAALSPEARRGAGARRSCTPERLIADLRGDLDRIVLKCVEKDPGRRYETTDDLARDLVRFLHHEPVQARPRTPGYRAAKFIRRRRAAVTVAAAAAVALLSIGFYHTQRISAERDRAQSEARKAAKVSELLTELVTAGDPFRTPSPQGTLEASAARVRREFATQPDVRAEILNAVGRVHLRRGDHEKALPILTEALAAGREIGRLDVRLAQTLSDLGVLRREKGEIAAAIPLFEETLALRRQLWGNDHNEVAISLVELGRAHSSLERLEQAEPLFREALAIRQKVLGPEHREIAVSLGDLGSILWQKGELAAAEPLLLGSLAMHRSTVGNEHPNVAQALANLALLRVDQGDLAAAEHLLHEALPATRRALGETHWRTARQLGNLALVWRKQGRFREAAAALDEALPLARKTLGPDQPLIAALSVERAQVHLAEGEAAAAELLLREALRVQRLSYGESGWRIGTTKSVLGAALLALGRIGAAETLLVEASRALPSVPGPRGRETQPTSARLAALQHARLTALPR